MVGKWTGSSNQSGYSVALVQGWPCYGFPRCRPLYGCRSAGRWQPSSRWVAALPRTRPRSQLALISRGRGAFARGSYIRQWLLHTRQFESGDLCVWRKNAWRLNTHKKISCFVFFSFCFSTIGFKMSEKWTKETISKALTVGLFLRRAARLFKITLPLRRNKQTCEYRWYLTDCRQTINKKNVPSDRPLTSWCQYFCTGRSFGAPVLPGPFRRDVPPSRGKICHSQPKCLFFDLCIHSIRLSSRWLCERARSGVLGGEARRGGARWKIHTGTWWDGGGRGR